MKGFLAPTYSLNALKCCFQTQKIPELARDYGSGKSWTREGRRARTGVLGRQGAQARQLKILH